MPPKPQDSLRDGAGVDDIMKFHSHPTRWWDSWKQHPEGNSSCRRRIWIRPGFTVVIFTELPDNEGMSVTNAFERLAAMTLNDFPTLVPTEIIWVEHYAPYRDSHGVENETLDLGLPLLFREGPLWRSQNCYWRWLWKRSQDSDENMLPPNRLALRRWLLGLQPDLLTTPARLYADVAIEMTSSRS